jgi:branched-chain amino acid transport system ATP-binding protein/sulfate-transporting ATPase
MADITKVKEKFKDISIIIIEHDMMVIEQIAKHVVVFNYGKKIAEGPYSDVVRNKEVLEAYLGEESEDVAA